MSVMNARQSSLSRLEDAQVARTGTVYRKSLLQPRRHLIIVAAAGNQKLVPIQNPLARDVHSREL
ncbi:MAG: hypothetical protein WA828_08655, partial [Coleofasciculaceae cyanobacterium]